jgi:hypothetical protein
LKKWAKAMTFQNPSKIERAWFQRLFSNNVDKIGEEKQQDKEKGVDRELGLFEQPFRFFHGLFFPERFPKDQEKIEKD